jgi:hypothetical protein
MDEPVFHIGRAPKVNKYARKPRKEKKKKLRDRKKDRLPSTVQSRRRLRRVGHLIQTKFIPYTGRRMHMPPGYGADKDIRSKVGRVLSQSIFNLIEISIDIEKLEYETYSFDCFSYKWKGPICIQIYLANARLLNVFSWIRAREFLQKIPLHFGTINRFIRNWRVRRCIRNVKNTEDIATMEVPTQPVYIIDFTNHCSYVFQALTIKKAMERRLLQSEWMFIDAAEPVNPYTNKTLSPCQLFSVLNQLESFGRFSWILDRFRASQFCITNFTVQYHQILKIEAIKNHFLFEKGTANETVIDFFNTYAEDVDYPSDRKSRLIQLIRFQPNHSLTKQWYSLAREYYISEQLNDPTRMLTITYCITALLQKSYSMTV